MKRRNFLRTIVASSLMITSVKKVNAQVENWLDNNASVPKVYFIKDITSENLIKIYEALGRKAEGKNVLSDGKPKARMWQSNYRQEKLATPTICNLP